MHFLLFPFYLLYQLIVYLRNILFDIGLFPSKKFNIPIISIGNLCMGGTGKTPHVDYLLEILKKKYNVAVLSRGYRRNSKGFVMLESSSDYDQVGDEPLQLKKKHPNCIIAVCKSRKFGINKLLKQDPAIDVIILDDAFQHRWISAGLNILITSYQKPFYSNSLLPFGTLREQISEKKRADIVIVSKTPKLVSLIQKKEIKEKLQLEKSQLCFFSEVKYLKWSPLFNSNSLEKEEVDNIILVTGIVNSNLLEDMLKKEGYLVEHMKYPDHHKFTEEDAINILNVFNSNKSMKKLILTTEKDSVRLMKFKSIFERALVYCIPIEVIFERKKEFNTRIIDYVEENTRNN